MDKKRVEDVGLFEGMRLSIAAEAKRRREDGFVLVKDLLIFAVALLFARCHIIFGAYPLSISFVAMLPQGVWVGLLGAVLGSLSLGKSGAIHALIAVITVFLRIIVSGGERAGDRRLFSESVTLRVCSAGIGLFIGAVYQLLLDGFSVSAVLYGLIGVSLGSALTFVFSGIFVGDIRLRDVVYSRASLLSRRNFESDKQKFDLAIFQLCALVLGFFISYSLRSYSFFGVSPAYIFSVFVTLFCAKRFGAIRATAVGFVTSLAVSGAYSVAFALVGLGAGAVFAFGLPYAIIASGSLLCVWSAYIGSVEGLLSTLPEFLCAAILSLPLLRSISREKEELLAVNELGVSERMVNMSALTYKNKSTERAEGELASRIKSLSEVVRSFGRGEGRVSYGEYRDAVIYDVREHCLSCPSYESCIEQSPAPCAENIDLIASKLSRGERLFSDDINLFPRYCENRGALAERILATSARLEGEKQRNRRMSIRARDFELISSMLDESLDASRKELCVDGELGKRLTQLLCEFGIGEPSVKVFGKRHRHIIGAGVDEGGKISTSKELKAAIEATAGFSLGEGDFYKKDKFILFEYDEVPGFDGSFAFACAAGEENGVSGDSALSFESCDGRFYAMLADGEGSGEYAKETSSLSCDFLSRVMGASISKSTAIQSLNHTLRHRENECSVTIDLFELDLYTGEGVFYKCGAASSYIKREGSIFRVRSESAPIGVMKAIDAERIRVDVRHGDYVVLISDGIATGADDSTWLVELLNRESVKDIKEYAQMILEHARERVPHGDDMSVAVIKVSKRAA